MGTEVLRPQDLFAARFRVHPPSFQRRRSLTDLVVNRKLNNNVGGYNKKASPRPEKKKSNTVQEGKKPSPARKENVVGGTLIGPVTLLRRGESWDSFTSKTKANDDLGIGRIGPDSPEIRLKQIHLHRPIDGYAGSAFSLSPSPRSLPLPSFFKKLNDDGKTKPFEDSATRDLRRLLRLD